MKPTLILFVTLGIAAGLLVSGCAQNPAAPNASVSGNTSMGGYPGTGQGAGTGNTGQGNATTPVNATTTNTTSANATQNPASQVSPLYGLSGGGFNAPGNVLITDQFNNRVIEVDPSDNSIVWSFGSGNPDLCNPGPGSIIGTNYAERLADGLTLIAGTGIPSSGTSPGCADNRVIVVNQSGDIVWQYGQAGVSGSDFNMLNVPVSAIELPNGDYLITDQGNNRIIEVNSSKDATRVVWSYGPSSGPGALNSPNSAELLDNGNILIADENNNRTIEVDRDGNIVWKYDDVSLGAVAFASRLPGGNTLITDSGNARILEVTPDGNVAFQYYTNASAGSNPSPLPTNAVMFGDGNIMIADQDNHRVFAIDYQKKMLWQYGMTNAQGNGVDELNGPYTAFVIGDYTGQTAPPGLMMKLSSPSFTDGGNMPSQFTCEGADFSPTLLISDVPAGTKSVAMTVYDIDAPFVHWVAWDFSPGDREIPEHVSGNRTEGATSVGIEGQNGLGTTGYIGPCPPPGKAHRYFFRAYALDTVIDLPESTNLNALHAEMDGHVLGSAGMVGVYKCSRGTPAADGLCR